jgi:hypothetical protein
MAMKALNPAAAFQQVGPRAAANLERAAAITGPTRT